MFPQRREAELNRRGESDSEIRESDGTNRNKQWDSAII
jgi:hypothetical protein